MPRVFGGQEEEKYLLLSNKALPRNPLHMLESVFHTLPVWIRETCTQEGPKMHRAGDMAQQQRGLTTFAEDSSSTHSKHPHDDSQLPVTLVQGI